jgi:eukaryotic-like serine/threonine-protein kinase
MAEAKIADIGKYHIVALVGEGAMGVVYKAVDSVLQRTVAIKVMNEAIARSEELRQRFLREAQAAASIQHPNVVSVYDLGESDGHLFIAMEFVPGADLEDLIESNAKLSLQAKLDIIIDVLTGLTYAHKRGVVHRDIKPANIRVAEDGRAKIMDFGVAHLASSNLTSTGASLGTPSYMAPEQITTGKVAPASDIFSVGAVLYELLTRTKPFDGATLQNLLFRIVTEKPPRPSEVMIGLPPALDRIVERAMAKEMSARYQSALDMANELSLVRGELGGHSYPTSVSLNARVSTAIALSNEAARARIWQRGIWSVGAAAAIVVALVSWMRLTKPRAETASAGALSASESAPIAADSSRAPAAAMAAKGPLYAPPQVTQPAPSAPSASSARGPLFAPPQTTASAPNAPAPTSRASTNASSTASGAPTRVAIRSVPQSAPASPAANTPLPAPQPVVQQQTITPRAPAASASVVQQAPVSAPPTPPAPTAATAADLAPVFDAYARAIESRDIAAIRRVYPGLTAEQERGFEQFFQAARKINVTFRVANVESTAAAADARLNGTYEYESSSGKIERQPVSFAASLRREGGEWRLVSLR